QSVCVLAIAQRVATTASVAQAEVQESIRSKSELTRLVVVKRLVHGQKNALSSGINLVCISRNRIFSNHGLPLAYWAGVVINVEAWILCEVRVKRYSQKP